MKSKLNKFPKQLLSLALACIMFFGAVSPALATTDILLADDIDSVMEEIEIMPLSILNINSVVNGSSGTGWSFNNNILTINDGANVTVNGTGAWIGRRIVMNGTSTININDVNLVPPTATTGEGANVITVRGNATINVTGNNRLDAGSAGNTTASVGNRNGAGIFVPTGASVVIQGSGYLRAYGGHNHGGSPIGGGSSSSNQNLNAGTITIQGDVNVRTQSRGDAAGIGGGDGGVFTGTFQEINIRGNAHVHAYGGTWGPGIGGGTGGGTININENVSVIAIGGLTNGAGIGVGGDNNTVVNTTTVNITGGQITAIGRAGANGGSAGIGGSRHSGAGNINISGGTIRAFSGATTAAGIGGTGNNIDNGTIRIWNTPNIAATIAGGNTIASAAGSIRPQPFFGETGNTLAWQNVLIHNNPTPANNLPIEELIVPGVATAIGDTRLTGLSPVSPANPGVPGGTGNMLFLWLPISDTAEWMQTYVGGYRRIWWGARAADHLGQRPMNFPGFESLTPNALTNGMVGEPYSQVVTVVHNQPTLAPVGTWTTTATGLPAGLDLTFNDVGVGEITGVPLESGTFEIIVTASQIGNIPTLNVGLGTRTFTLTLIIEAPPWFNVQHQFVSGTPNAELPAEVRDLLPSAQTEVLAGTTVYPTSDFPLEVAVNDPVLGRGVWHFDGWHTNSATVVDGDVLFTGTWVFVPNMLTLTFDGNNGSLNDVPTSIQVQEGSTANGSSPNDPFPTTEPRRRFYIFTGWNTVPDGSGVEVTAETVILENMTAYAQWIPHMLTVTFDANGGDLDTVPVSIEVQRGSFANGINPNDPFPTTIPMPPSIGYGNFSWNDYYVFMGWNTEADGSGVEVTASMIIMKNITAYAQWRLFPRCNLHEWDPYETYYEGDYVIYQGVIYVALVDWRGQGDLDWRPLLARSVWAPTNHYLHASCAPIVFADPWDPFAFYTTGDFVTFNGRVYRSLHTLQGIGVPDWNPTAVPSMWETTNISITSIRPISERPIPGHIPDWDATRLYFPGDRAFFDGRVYEAIVAVQGRGDLQWNPAMHQSIWRWISDWNE